MIPYKPPKFRETSFNCPNCNSFAQQDWSELVGVGNRVLAGYLDAKCVHCGKHSIWFMGNMVYPDIPGAPLPNPDMPNDINEDYLEARSIINRSPRGAAALLRLCIQKLCEHLGEPGKDINKDIANLVKKGLPLDIQKALDIVRVIGNNAVHPGQIDLKDDTDTASRLFDLVNIITQVMITQPKEIEKLYGRLPKTAKEQIKKRDKN
jgi:hypothetical protein